MLLDIGIHRYYILKLHFFLGNIFDIGNYNKSKQI